MEKLRYTSRVVYLVNVGILEGSLNLDVSGGNTPVPFH